MDEVERKSNWLTRNRPSWVLVRVVLFSCAGFGIGFICCMVCMLFLEFYLETVSKTHASVSYGQTAALVVVPSCGLIAAGIGFSLGFLPHRNLCRFFLLIVSVLSCVSNWNSWVYYRRQNGIDPSEIILYYPPFAICLVGIVLATVIGRFGTLRGNEVRGEQDRSRPDLRL